jgi:hypothetical protein
MDLPEKGVGCHRTGFEKDCRALVVDGRCKRWMQIQGANPNTGEQMNRSMCVDDWGPFLQMETSQQVRQAGAAIESHRNENSAVNNVALQALQNLVRVAQAELPPADPKLIEG